MYNFINNINNLHKKLYKPINININKDKFIDKDITTSKTVSLFSQPYLDTYNECYKNIVVINLMPKGPLSKLVRFVKFPRLSEFKCKSNCNKIKDCGLALASLRNNCGDNFKNGNDLMMVDEIPDLITFLTSNGYIINTSLTKMFNTSDIRFDTNIGNKLVCFITYNE